MARHKKDGGDLGPAFWVLFVVGMVVVLSLFRGFMAALQNSFSAKESKRRRKKKAAAAADEHQD